MKKSSPSPLRGAPIQNRGEAIPELPHQEIVLPAWLKIRGFLCDLCVFVVKRFLFLSLFIPVAKKKCYNLKGS